MLFYQQTDILKTTVEELNKEIVDKNKTIEQMQTKIMAKEELMDKLTKVIAICHCLTVVPLFFTCSFVKTAFF